MMRKRLVLRVLATTVAVAGVGMATAGTASAMPREWECAAVYNTYHSTTDPDVGFDMANRWTKFCGDYSTLEP
jgi:hypothetical protein